MVTLSQRLSLTLLLFLASIPTPSSASIARIMEEMDRHMERMRQEMHMLFSTVGQAQPMKEPHRQPVTLADNNDAVIITFHLSKDINTFDAETKGKSLVISIPQENRKIRISMQGRLLTVEVMHQAKEQAEQEKGKSSFVSYGASSMAQMLQQPVNLEQAKIEYDNDQLLVTLPKVVQPQGKKVPVTIKGTEGQKEATVQEK